MSAQALDSSQHQSSLVKLGISLSCAELWLLLFVGVLGLIGVLGPHISQYENYHDFADQMTWLGIEHIWDVVSNIPFAVIGIWGLALTRRSALTVAPSTMRDMSFLFFYGLIITSVCSSIYHLHPDNMSLWLDRLGMSVAFAGVLGLAIGNRVSERAGQVGTYMALIVAPFCLWVWQCSENLLGWCLFQGGGMVIVVVLAFLKPIEHKVRIPLMAIIASYVLAKVLELGDYAIFQATAGWVSGHSLKHVVSALAALPLINLLKQEYKYREMAKTCN